ARPQVICPAVRAPVRAHGHPHPPRGPADLMPRCQARGLNRQRPCTYLPTADVTVAARPRATMAARSHACQSLRKIASRSLGSGGVRMRLLIALLLMLVGLAAAATITISGPEGDTPAVVAVQGLLKSADIEVFRFRVARLSKAIVAFESDGGSLLAGNR